MPLVVTSLSTLQIKPLAQFLFLETTTIHQCIAWLLMCASYFVTQNIKKKCVQGQDVTQLFLFTVSSRTFLCETGIFPPTELIMVRTTMITCIVGSTVLPHEGASNFTHPYLYVISQMLV